MRKIQEEKGIVIKSLQDEPELGIHLRWIWTAFTDLSYRRGAGFGGPLPITYSDIASYCDLKGIRTASDKERLVRFIDALDKAYMAKSYADKPADKNPKTKQVGNDQPPRHKRRPPITKVI